MFGMLNDFLTANREQLIALCREKATKRRALSDALVAIDDGVPLFLLQLADTLSLEHSVIKFEVSEAEVKSRREQIGRAAAMHGAKLLRTGYSIDQVVRDYGDVCQSVTELAMAQAFEISTDEFRILNGCLDDAIAGAVTSFGYERQQMTDDMTEHLHVQLKTFSGEHRRLAGIAIQSFSAIKTGTVGLSGATGLLLTYALEELQTLSERTLPEIHLLAEATAVTAR